MFDLKTNVLIWKPYLSTTMKSVIHLGLECDQKLIACQNTNFKRDQDVVRCLFEADCGNFIRNFEFIYDDV